MYELCSRKYVPKGEESVQASFMWRGSENWLFDMSDNADNTETTVNKHEERPAHLPGKHPVELQVGVRQEEAWSEIQLYDAL